MFTEPRIVINKDLKKRTYVSFYFNGVNHKVYTGNKLGLDIFPNNAKNFKDRKKLVEQLQNEISIRLRDGRFNPDNKVIDYKARIIINEALQRKLNDNLSKSYKSDLKLVVRAFLKYLPKEVSENSIFEMRTKHIEEFLNSYNTSNTNFMNKRTNLMAIFSEISRIVEKDIDIVRKVKRKKILAKLHEIYTHEELKFYFDYFERANPHLHLCCLLIYGTFLRPHNEIRLLAKKHFNKDYSVITLSGFENKSGAIRTVNVPKFVQDKIRPILDSIKREDNIFSLCPQPFNDDYFRTLWTRIKKTMLEEGVIRKEQTMYSFRHTAAVNVYRKTKDLHILQQLLGHSDMIVTLKYLRGLGVHNTEELRNVMPEL